MNATAEALAQGFCLRLCRHACLSENVCDGGRSAVLKVQHRMFCLRCDCHATGSFSTIQIVITEQHGQCKPQY